jgi:hypothetical protein
MDTPDDFNSGILDSPKPVFVILPAEIIAVSGGFSGYGIDEEQD